MRNRVTLAIATILLTACAVPFPFGGSPLQGSVSFETGRRVQATPADVGVAATISLIDPTTGTTIATTLSTPAGAFSLALPGFSPQVKTYYLEALKGLNTNQAGHDAARLRTLVRWSGSGWQALTTGDASIGISTTALSAIVALRAPYSAVNPDLLIGKLTLGSPDAFADAGTGVSGTEYTNVSTLVTTALTTNVDPLATLRYNGSSYSLSTSASEPAPFISGLSPSPAQAGAQVTVTGGNFATPAANNTVTLGGTPIVPDAGTATSLTLTLPGNATSGTLQVTTADGSATFALTLVPGVGGGVFGGPSVTLPTTSNGTDVPGNVLGRLAAPWR